LILLVNQLTNKQANELNNNVYEKF